MHTVECVAQAYTLQASMIAWVLYDEIELVPDIHMAYLSVF